MANLSWKILIFFCQEEISFIPSKHLIFLITNSFPDNEDPMITCPSSISSGTTPSLNTSVVWWTVPTATDNTGVASVVSDYTPGQMFPVGNTLVTYNATDLGGNVAICSFYVNVTGMHMYWW